MSEEKKVTNAASASPAKPAKKKTKNPSKVAKWFREMKSELKKVTWPTRKQVINNSWVVAVVVFICAVILWGFDTLGSSIVELIFTIF